MEEAEEEVVVEQVLAQAPAQAQALVQAQAQDLGQAQAQVEVLLVASAVVVQALLEQVAAVLRRTLVAEQPPAQALRVRSLEEVMQVDLQCLTDRAQHHTAASVQSFWELAH